MGLLTDPQELYAHNGRVRAQFIDRIMADALARVEDEPQAKALLEELVQMWRQGGNVHPRDLLQVRLWGPDYRWVPVSIREFINGADYLGRSIGPGTYPQIIDDLEELFAGD